MYIHVSMPESRNYRAYLEGLYVKTAFAANEEEGWIDLYVVDENNRLILKTDETGERHAQKQRVYGKVELRQKDL